MALNGYIKLHRKLTEWEWYSDMKVSRVFIHLLLTANFKDTNWRGQLVRRGQLIIGKESLGKELGLTIQEVKTVFRKLKKTKEITTRATNKNTVVTLVNFEVYQDSEGHEQPTTQPTNNQQATNEQPQRNNDKKDKNKEEDSFDKRINKQLPFDVVTTSQTLKALYSDKTEAIEMVKDCFQIDATEQDVQKALHTFATVAVASYDKYRGIRTIEMLKNKFIHWIPKSIKYEATQKPSAKSDNSESLDLESYLAEHYKPSELKHMATDGRLQTLETQWNESKFKYSNITKAYKNKTLTPLVLFELSFMTLGRNLAGSTPQRKVESFQRWLKKLSEYDQTQGDIRQMLKSNKN